MNMTQDAFRETFISDLPSLGMAAQLSACFFASYMSSWPWPAWSHMAGTSITLEQKLCQPPYKLFLYILKFNYASYNTLLCVYER